MKPASLSLSLFLSLSLSQSLSTWTENLLLAQFKWNLPSYRWILTFNILALCWQVCIQLSSCNMYRYHPVAPFNPHYEMFVLPKARATARWGDFNFNFDSLLFINRTPVILMLCQTQFSCITFPGIRLLPTCDSIQALSGLVILFVCLRRQFH